MSTPRKRRQRSYKGDQSKRRALYTPVKSGDVPGALDWKRSVGQPSRQVIVEYSFGNLYKRVTDTRTRDVIYYRLLVPETPASPAEIIDAEPTKQRSYISLGSRCWFVDTDSRWYLCTVVARNKARMSIRPVTGYDDTREKPWPYGGELEFPARTNNPVYQRLRPLKARQA